MKPLAISCTPEVTNALHMSDPTALYRFLALDAPVDCSLLFVVWHWKVPAGTLKDHTCYGMHTGPLLQGRGKGASPIKNLLAQGHKWSTVCVFEMTEYMDEGKVLISIPISLEGTEENVLRRIDDFIPSIQAYLAEDESNIPVQWKRLTS